jgi:hypothetical protein
MRHIAVLAATMVLVAGGCASKNSAAAPPGTQPPPAPRMDTNIITAAELEGTNFDNVATAVVVLRPQWTKYDVGRVTSVQPTLVYNEKELIGSFERLKEIKVSEVKELRWLTRDQARVRYGPNAQAGIMMVRK